jgi:hypothetical protein
MQALDQDFGVRNSDFGIEKSFVGAGPRACPIFGQTPIEKLRKANCERGKNKLRKAEGELRKMRSCEGRIDYFGSISQFAISS